ncbi:MAG: type II secretion system inner membrane protein GspF [Planctomycetes bacterium]|nr:type II secretion system inner membrane protein GspF [Planctomycetota bacterium]
MPVFHYKALKDNGEVRSGVIDADTPRDARTKLRVQNLFVTDLQTAVGAATPAEAQRTKVPLPQFLSRRRLSELAVVTRQLATLLNAGITLSESLKALVEQAESKSLETALRDIRERIAGGTTFADALAFHPNYFNELYVNMVRAGEAAGTLGPILARLADYLQAQNRLRGKVVAALTYPIIMLMMGFLVMLFLLVFVVPKITQVLIQQKRTMPVPTQILIAVSSFMKSYWWLVLALLAALYALVQLIKSTDRGRLWWDTWILKVPILGTLFKKQAISRFAATFATLLESGIPAMAAIAIVRNVVDNMRLAVTLDEVRTKIMEGADISTPIKKSKVFPAVVGYMIAIGEESGQLENLLRKVAETYDEEIEVTAQRVTSLLEPCIIVLMAVVVGFIVLSILLPILEISRLR